MPLPQSISENAFPGMQEIYYIDNKDKIPIMLNRENNTVVMPPAATLDPPSGVFVVTDQDGLIEGNNHLNNKLTLKVTCVL